MLTLYKGGQELHFQITRNDVNLRFILYVHIHNDNDLAYRIMIIIMDVFI